MTVFRVIGLMSGTSMDGIDASLIRTDGEGVVEREGFISLPYDDALRADLRACLNLPADARARAADAERAVTEAHARAVDMLLRQQGISPGDVDLIGFHGQTVAHAPDIRYTCQLGDGALLARLTGIRVVNDFRTADVLAGGQGAPLVPVYHQALAAGFEKPVVFVNIGGVSNITYVGADGAVMAFDTGTGNALLDDWMLQKTGKKYDAAGETAAQGTVDQAVLAQLMAHPFFAAPPPKSLDRNSFASGLWAHLPPADGAATLAAFTVAGIARAADFLPQPPRLWVVCGGGRLNGYIMQGLREKFAAPVRNIGDFGFDGDAIEAEAFAYLAVRSVKGLPISFPATTGVPQPMAGGRLNPVPDAA